MQCTSPIIGYRGFDGKISSSISKSWIDLRASAPCGRCIGCRIRKKREWGLRSYHEASLHDESGFFTLTYDDEHLPVGGSLVRDEVAKFVRSLRDRGHKIRYFAGAEYGDGETLNGLKNNVPLGRPHYHVLLFGFWPDDAEKVRGGDEPLFTSEYLRSIWGKGKCDFGHVTPHSADYCAGYAAKKMYGKTAQNYYQKIDPDTGEVYPVVPEFSRQSRRPGLGERWITRYLYDVYPKDQVVISGVPRTPPKYYDDICKKLDPALFAKVKSARRAREVQNWELVQKSAPGNGSRLVRVHKTPDAYKGSHRQMLARSKIQQKTQTERGNFQ